MADWDSADGDAEGGVDAPDDDAYAMLLGAIATGAHGVDGVADEVLEHALDEPDRAVLDATLRLTFYWFNFMPLTR